MARREPDRSAGLRVPEAVCGGGAALPRAFPRLRPKPMPVASFQRRARMTETSAVSSWLPNTPQTIPFEASGIQVLRPASSSPPTHARGSQVGMSRVAEVQLLQSGRSIQLKKEPLERPVQCGVLTSRLDSSGAPPGKCQPDLGGSGTPPSVHRRTNRTPSSPDEGARMRQAEPGSHSGPLERLYPAPHLHEIFFGGGWGRVCANCASAKGMAADRRPHLVPDVFQPESISAGIVCESRWAISLGERRTAWVCGQKIHK